MDPFSYEDDECVSRKSASRASSNPGSERSARSPKHPGDIALVELQLSNESRSLLSSADHRFDHLKNGDLDDSMCGRPPLAKRDGKLESTSVPYRRPYTLILVLLYCCIAVPGWTILCILKDRPLSTGTYSEISALDEYYLDPDRYKKNERWYHAAKILMAIANNLIIPLTSTVCASAAVVYVQHMGWRSQLNMTHTTTLADRGWTSPLVYLSLLTKKGWKSRGSGFLYFATCTIMFGATIPPLQQFYVEQESIKTATQPVFGPLISDIPDLLSYIDPGEVSIKDQNVKTDVLLRNAMSSTSPADLHPLLWQTREPNCTLHIAADDSSNGSAVALGCFNGGTTFQNISILQNPFVAQLPSQYHTGLIRQVIPQINTSISLEGIDQSDFPRNCDQIQGAYYKKYESPSMHNLSLSIQICMPANISYSSPWEPVRDRQDISERLFLNISWPEGNLGLSIPPGKSVTSALMVNSTMGYFELPNYHNGGVAGLLLASDPGYLCDNPGECMDQSRTLTDTVNTSEPIPQPTEILQVAGRGPLAMVVMALFDEGSYVDQTLARRNNDTKNNDWQETSGYSKCSGFVPLASLFDQGRGDIPRHLLRDTNCTDTRPTESFDELSEWLLNFEKSSERSSSENALHAAVLLASETWLTKHPGNSGGWQVNYDLGQDTIRPKISKKGVYLISTFLGLDLFLLLALAIYVCFSQTWTSSLDAFAMMKLGAARADELPLGIETDSEKVVEVLERIPGWVGDARPEGSVGLLALGAVTPLEARREYAYSPHNASLRT